MNVNTYVSDYQIGQDLTIPFAENAAANVQVVNVIPTPETGLVHGSYALQVVNPSTQTDLTVKVFNSVVGVGDFLVKNYKVVKTAAVTGTTISAYQELIEGLFLGGNLKIVISNDTGTVLTAFNATLRIVAFK